MALVSLDLSGAEEDVGVSKLNVAGMSFNLPANLDDFVVLHIQTGSPSQGKTAFQQTGQIAVPSGKQLRVLCGLFNHHGGTATNGTVRVGYSDNLVAASAVAGSFTNLVMWGGDTLFNADNAFDAQNKAVGNTLNQGSPINFVIPALKFPMMSIAVNDIGVAYCYCVLETP